MKIKLIIIFSVAVLAIIFITKYFIGSSHKSKAGENDVTIIANPIANPVSGTKNLDEFDITYVVSSDDQNKKITGLSMMFTANSNLQIISMAQTPKTFPNASDVFIPVIEPTINTTKSILNFAYITQSPVASLANAVSFKIRVKGITAGAGTLTLNRVSTEITGILTSSPVLFGISSTSNTDPSFTFSNANTALAINFKFEPITTTIGANTESAIAVFKIDGLPTGKGLTTFETTISFDKNVAEAVNITPSDIVVSKFNEVHKTIDNNAGTIKLTYLAKPIDGMILANDARFDITFRRKSALTAISTTNISINTPTATGDIDEISYQINKVNGQLVIHPLVTGSSSSSVQSSSSSSSSSRQSSSSSAASSSSSSQQSSSSSSSSAVSNHSSSSSSIPSTTPQITSVLITLKLRFQGILTEPYDMSPQNVKINVVKEGENNTGFIETSFNPGGDGTYKGMIGIDPVDYNAKYYIYVKGPKHLQKKFCDLYPQLNAQGFYSCSKAYITLHSGQNYFDFSKIKLLSGDLPEQGSVQNGIIDSYDLSFIRSSIANATYHDACDINLDKKCDWQDWSLVLASMAEKYDE